jgi:hypothetical protein
LPQKHGLEKSAGERHFLPMEQIPAGGVFTISTIGLE